MPTLRHRQLLLSLKHSTIEASFSVPVLQLTLGYMPFTIGFAVKALGWVAAGIGLLAATPFIGDVLQPPLSFLLQRYLSLRDMLRHMRGSAEFNPLLLPASVAQQLFEGRAVETLLRASKRALHRQRSALADVGGELAQDGWRALSRPFRRR